MGTQTVERFTKEATRNIFENLFNLLHPPNVAQKQRSAVWMIIKCPTLFENNCKDLITPPPPDR